MTNELVMVEKGSYWTADNRSETLRESLLKALISTCKLMLALAAVIFVGLFLFVSAVLLLLVVLLLLIIIAAGKAGRVIFPGR